MMAKKVYNMVYITLGYGWGHIQTNTRGLASEEVVLHLVNCYRKCIHVLLYGLEVCPLMNAELHSFPG